MSYGASPTRWTVKTVSTKGNPKFDLEVGDVLELTGNGNRDSTSVTKRHRDKSPSVEWGSVCAYDPKTLSVKGDHNASSGADEFLIIITPRVQVPAAMAPGRRRRAADIDFRQAPRPAV